MGEGKSFLMHDIKTVSSLLERERRGASLDYITMETSAMLRFLHLEWQQENKKSQQEHSFMNSKYTFRFHRMLSRSILNVLRKRYCGKIISGHPHYRIVGIRQQSNHVIRFLHVNMPRNWSQFHLKEEKLQHELKTYFDHETQ